MLKAIKVLKSLKYGYTKCGGSRINSTPKYINSKELPIIKPKSLEDFWKR